MILTGKEITKQVMCGNILISPFFADQINPNSYNYRIGNTVIKIDSKGNQKLMQIPETGLILKSKTLYLSSTFETLGSNKYAMSLIGRSSIGRLGLYLQVSANLGHTGSKHKWTLELYPINQIKIYPRMVIGQISFWENSGDLCLYQQGYSKYSAPTPSKLRVSQ